MRKTLITLGLVTAMTMATATTAFAGIGFCGEGYTQEMYDANCKAAMDAIKAREQHVQDVLAQNSVAIKDSGYTMTVDGKTVTFNDQTGYPYLNSWGYLMVPVETVANALENEHIKLHENSRLETGYNVQYQINDSWKLDHIGFGIGSPVINGGTGYGDEYNFGVESTIHNDVIYVPLRFMAEHMFYSVSLIGKNIELKYVGYNPDTYAKYGYKTAW